MSASEANWRIYQYTTSHQHPNTYRLPVHLEDKQRVTINEKEDLAKVIEKNKNTKLTEFFKMNQTNELAKTLLYHQMPQYFSWDSANNKWKIRRQKK